MNYLAVFFNWVLKITKSSFRIKYVGKDYDDNPKHGDFTRGTDYNLQ